VKNIFSNKSSLSFGDVEEDDDFENMIKTTLTKKSTPTPQPKAQPPKSSILDEEDDIFK